MTGRPAIKPELSKVGGGEIAGRRPAEGNAGAARAAEALSGREAALRRLVEGERVDAYGDKLGIDSQALSSYYDSKGAGETWGSTDNLIKSATTPGKSGVSPVGRAFQKHAGNPSRAGTFIGEVSGNAARNTEQGAQYISDILNNPQSTFKVRHTDVFGDILDVRLPDGTGARWSADGKTFIGFLEKYTK